jgi:hypothetical protein
MEDGRDAVGRDHAVALSAFDRCPQRGCDISVGRSTSGPLVPTIVATMPAHVNSPPARPVPADRASADWPRAATPHSAAKAMAR